MPALEITPLSVENPPVLGHVNLMVDTFIANAHPDDLRAAVRGLLATQPVALATAFAVVARNQFKTSPSDEILFSSPDHFFRTWPGKEIYAPTENVGNALIRARSLYGVGMGVDSLRILSRLVGATVGTKWEPESKMHHMLSVIDVEISQAIQSTKEEIEAGRVAHVGIAHEVISDLRRVVKMSEDHVKTWGGEFPFERALLCVDYWKVL